MDWQQLLKLNSVAINSNMLQVGLEREGQRIVETGQLAQTDLAPALIGKLSGLQRDFAETQVELVTPVCSNAEAAGRALTELTRQVRQGIAPELIWPLSVPPALPTDERLIPIAKLDRAAVAYREGLAERYGRRRQMLSGLHCNISLNPDLLTALFQTQTEITDPVDFRNQCYLHLAQNYLHYRWLLTYLYGCTPHVWPNSGFHESHRLVRSLRNGPEGYVNRPGLHVSYASLTQYCDRLQTAVARGQLSAVKEYYGQVRLRGGRDLSTLRQTGIQYLELRQLDLNPWSIIGVTNEQLQVVTWFTALMVWLPNPTDPDAWIDAGQHANQHVALEVPAARTQYFETGMRLAATLRELGQSLHQSAAEDVATLIAARLRAPESTLAARWCHETQGSVTQATQLALHLAARRI
ncbi:glutamate--cysteine ligase [Lactiplantibacillus pentosus]|uniref:glutamate--cysteine ligase n=1 Tax=Lactiplantibacillus pentosus TaxID=1589 RepID=UPI0021A35775|nr:glutamate--cysteine ligase [Lactiplantibacillus pentosus]MCT3296000.1 glutamate--cysteine ligase [Lactiplantibacillus pentosus]